MYVHILGRPIATTLHVYWAQMCILCVCVTNFLFGDCQQIDSGYAIKQIYVWVSKSNFVVKSVEYCNVFKIEYAVNLFDGLE